MKKFVLDTVLCSAFIFSLIGLFASATFLNIFEVFDPIGDMFDDFELTDLTFSQLQDDPIADDRIVMVNFGVIPREGIAQQIEILNKYEPKVIGLDAMLDFEKPWEEDSALVRVLSETDNIILAEDLQFDFETGEAITPLQPPLHIMQDNHLGFVDLLTNAESQEDLKMWS